MKTDKQVYSIFAANPQWIFELTGLESPGPCKLLLESEETLENHAGEYYNQIRTSELSDELRQILLNVFVNWLEQRLKHKGKAEIEMILLGELPDLRDTRSGQDLIQIGRQEGKIEGKIEGKRETLLALLIAKFGRIDEGLRVRIAGIESYEQLEKLLLQVLTIDSPDQLNW